MVFSSFTFLLLFMPLVVIVYYAGKNNTYRNTVLLVFSLLFYGWAEPKLVLLMLTLLIVNYYFAIFMDRSANKRIWLLAVIAVDVSVLFYFKYFNFTLHNINRLFGTSFTSNIVLPIGISFYLFQIMSYVFDVYLGKVKVQRSFLLLSTYVALFPQLVAGPIVRYESIEEQLQRRDESWNNFYEGLRRFIMGLGKKVIIANNVAILADMVFLKTSIGELNFTLAWIGAFTYTLYIYYDFSGYSDMAIGLGRMFGFEFVENFNYPYVSRSITEFWRRWHISLSSWFRDYIYIPLGGNRKGMKRQLFNICVVWALTGLWHGAAWNFVLWGVYFAVILIIEKTFLLKVLDKLPVLFRHLYTLLLVMIGWVIFYSTSFTQIAAMLKAMMNPATMMSLAAIKNLRIIYLWPYVLLGVICSVPFVNELRKKLEEKTAGKVFVDIVLLVIVFICFLFLVNNSYNPFIYYRF